MLNSNTPSRQALLCKVYQAILIAALCIVTSTSLAVENTWGVSPYFGLYQPKLSDLNDGEFLAPHEGEADIINATGNNTTDSFIYQSPLPAFNPGSLVGLEFQLQLNEQHTITLGGANWQATSSAVSRGLIPVQGNFESVLTERKADLSYLEYYLGWRYNILTMSKKYRFYASTSLHHVYDIDYRESFTMVFTTGPARTFRKSITQTAQATGLSLLQGTAGAEYFISDSFSLSLEGGYVLGLKDLELGDNQITSDVLATDNVRVQLPMLPSLDDGNLTYKTEPGQEREDYQKLKLDFNGWKALIKATLYF